MTEIIIEQLKAVRPTITLDDLKSGEELDLGRGVTVQAFLNEQDLISFIRFSHLHDGEKCTKIVTVRQKRKKWRVSKWDGWGGGFYDGYWDIHVDKKRLVSLTPSLLCTKHHVHGYLRNGKWTTLLDWFLDDPIDLIERKIRKAESDAEEFGGGYQGAILALAAKQHSVR